MPSLATADSTPSRVLVRPILDEEFTAVGELTARVYVDEAFDEGGEYSQALRDVAGRAADALVLVAVDGENGRLLGGVTVALAGGRLAEQAGPGDAVVRMLVVDPTARGRGVGAALMDDCLRRAREAGLSRMILSTQPTMHAAHRLYERLGFARLPERDWSPRPGVDLLVYTLPL